MEIIERKNNLELLGVTLEEDLTNWDTHIEYLLTKASSRLYILRICKYYKYSVNNLDLLFQSLILSTFNYAIEVGVAPFIVSIFKLVELTSSLLDVLNLVTAQSSTVLLTYYMIEIQSYGKE